MNVSAVKYLSAATMLTLAACAGSKFNINNVQNEERIVIAKVVTTINGTAYTERMEACFEGKTSHKTTCAPVDERGYVYFATQAEPMYVRKLDLGNHADTPTLTFENLEFNVSPVAKHTYIGTLYTDIAMLKDPATANMPKQTLVDKLRDGYVSGYKYDVKLYAADEAKAAISDYATYTAQSASQLETATSLAESGKGLKWRSHVRAGL